MNKESFLETVKQQYSEEIHEAYLEHEHGLGGKVDFHGLNKSLQKLMANARVEGISQQDFEEIARTTLPSEIHSGLEFKPAYARKAA